MCLPTYVYAQHALFSACLGWKRALDPLELELQLVVSHEVRTETGSSVR